MEVQTKAYELSAYTIRETGKEKVIPKHHRWAIGNRLNDIAFSLVSHIDMANTMRLDNSLEREQRFLEQRLALGDTFKILTGIHIVYSLSKFDMDKMKYWIGSVIEIQELLRGWIESDRKRVKRLETASPMEND